MKNIFLLYIFPSSFHFCFSHRFPSNEARKWSSLFRFGNGCPGILGYTQPTRQLSAAHQSCWATVPPWAPSESVRRDKHSGAQRTPSLQGWTAGSDCTGNAALCPRRGMHQRLQRSGETHRILKKKKQKWSVNTGSTWFILALFTLNRNMQISNPHMLQYTVDAQEARHIKCIFNLQGVHRDLDPS